MDIKLETAFLKIQFLFEIEALHNNFTCNSNMYPYGMPMRTRTHNECHYREYSFKELKWTYIYCKYPKSFLDVVHSRHLHQLFFYILLYFVDHSTHVFICIRIGRNRFSAFWCPCLLKYDYTALSIVNCQNKPS